MIPHYGSCIPILQEVRGITLEVNVAILFPVSLRPRAFELHSDVLERVQTELSQQVGLCTICESDLESDGSSTIYYLLVKIQTSVSCPFEKLRSVLQAWSRNGMSHTLNVNSWIDEYELVIAIVTNYFPSDDSKLTLSYLLGSEHCTGATRFNSEMEEVCPWINMRTSSLEGIGLDKDKINILFKRTNDHGPILSYDDYRNLLTVNNNTDEENQDEDHVVPKLPTLSEDVDEDTPTSDDELLDTETINATFASTRLAVARQELKSEETGKLCLEDYSIIDSIFHQTVSGSVCCSVKSVLSICTVLVFSFLLM